MAEGEGKPKKPKRKVLRKKTPVAPKVATVSSAPEVVPPSPEEPAVEAPKIVLKDAHKIRDPRAMTTVVGKRTVTAYAANRNIQIVKGRKIPVPRAAVEDLERFGCIHPQKNARKP